VRFVIFCRIASSAGFHSLATSGITVCYNNLLSLIIWLFVQKPTKRGAWSVTAISLWLNWIT